MRDWVAAVLASLPCPASVDGQHVWMHERRQTKTKERWGMRCYECLRRSPGIVKDRNGQADERTLAR
jgi:hypothetical protein